jgi:catechol 2,3-dioxygenase-like lactoylglutathione lyase family enzyme
MMLRDARLVAFAATTDLDRAAAFYVDRLGLALLERTPLALVLDGGGTRLRVTRVEEKAAAPYTVLGWAVDDLDAVVEDLRARGVAFTRYRGLEQDEHDAWIAPGGARIAWFRDPDGNVLSLQEPPHQEGGG